MYISARERKMIELLLLSNETVAIKEIAESLDVSTRTVHRDLQGIETLLMGHDLLLKKTAGKGVIVEGEQENRKSLQEAINNQDAVDYTPEERQVLILSKLLEIKQPIKLFALAHDLGVTVATISYDLDKIEQMINDFQLELIRKRGYGVEVKGSESRIREAISSLIMEHMNELDFIKLLRENVQDSSLDMVSERLLGLVSRDKISLIEQTIETIRPSLNYNLTDQAYIGLVIHIALALERLKQGEFIRMDEDYLHSLRNSKEFKVAGKLIEKLEETFHIEIPEAETGYVTMHLMGAKVRYDTDVIIEDSSLSIAFKAKQLIEFVSKALNHDLQESNQLLNDLVVHLKPSVYRIQQQMDIQNPLTEQIEQDYPELFEIVQDGTAHVFPGMTFPKEEAAYIVMHFASALLNMRETRGLHVLVVCSSGMGTAKILAAKLQQQFYEIEGVEHRSLFDLEKLDHQSYDLTISTIPLSDFTDYVLVNPMLPLKDVHKVQHAVRKAKMNERMKRVKLANPLHVKGESIQSIQQSVESIQHYAATVNQIIEHLAVLQTNESDKQRALIEACEYLQRIQVLNDANKVVHALLEREEVGGLGIPDTKLAIYHAKLREIIQPCFMMITLKKEARVLGMDGEMMASDRFIIMLAPSNLTSRGNEVLSYLSSLIVEEKECTKVLESDDEEQMKNYFSNKLYHFLRNKLTN
ncbi:BglG family transcription antiterminator [Halobacillus shinanisalinarum]|uniref:BglG family transcription antiterminator n=1 Tax=Halobacillus shinanisalinarum TaxID=2932258 RepID=A0ABY4GWJ8_9BACI|nr:PRD domain-containing protein [Halobacillus shinanisalinarum]UOQ92546.1 BglG family transcription antiterminator [Halobacillus shinanisalinarum]